MTKYGFIKHLSSEFPSQIVVDVTQFCNLACIHCPHSEFIKSDSYSGANLSVELNKKLVDEVASDGYGKCQYLRYTANGETLIHPRFGEMIEYACRYSKTRVNVTTNGVLLNDKNSELLLKAGVDVVDISIDAFYDDTYAKIRKKGDLRKVRSNILKFLEKRNEDNFQTKLVVSFVEQPDNTKETILFEDYWKDKGADYVLIRRLHSAGGSKSKISEKISEWNADIKRKPCLYPWERLVLTPTGEIGFCPAGWTGESHIIDFKRTTIKDVWQGEFMNSLREAHLNNHLEKFSLCNNCPDWVFTKWPDEGRAYSDMMQEIIPKDLICDEDL